METGFMGMDWSMLAVFAEAAEGAVDAANGQGPPPSMMFFAPLLFLVALFYFMIVIPERKREKRRREQIDGLKKNDKIITSAGIYGVVANAKPGEPDMVIKIDEDKDVKIRISKASIAQVLTAKEEPAAGGASAS